MKEVSNFTTILDLSLSNNTVLLDNNTVSIYDDGKLLIECKASKIFFQKSELVKSYLIKIANCNEWKYIYVDGRKVVKFITDYEIKNLKSKYDKNYAIDSKGNYYMLEVMFILNHEPRDDDNPYNYFYNLSTIVRFKGDYHQPLIKNFKKIKTFKRSTDNTKLIMNAIYDWDNDLYSDTEFIFTNGKKKKVTKKIYNNFINAFRKRAGIKKINHEIIKQYQLLKLQ